MTREIYLEVVIRTFVYPLHNELGEHFIFTNDNARTHPTRRVQVTLEEGKITRLNWPANSPDMNHVENTCERV